MFGVYTKISAIVLLSLNALMSALVCVLVFLIARISFGERVAKWSGWAWAFCPYAIYFPVERIWETWLATLLLCWLFLMTLDLENESRSWKWAAFGLVWGVAALTSPALLSVLPFLAGWVIYRRQCRGQRWFAVNVVASIAFIAVISPWFIRNYEVFHRVVPFRDNMGIVLRLGTKGTTAHWGPYELGPWHNDAEWNEFKQLGELGYFDKKKRQAVEIHSRESRMVRLGNGAARPLFMDRLLEPGSRLSQRRTARSAQHLVLHDAYGPRAAGIAAGLAGGLVGSAALCARAFSFPLIYYITSPGSLLSASD